MKKQQGLNEEIETNGIDARVDGKEIILSKNGEEIRRKIYSTINVKVDGNKIIISSNKSLKNDKKLIYSLKAHLKNMINGLNEKFKYKLQVASVHFPITLTHDKATNELVVKNFLGEKKDRKIKLVEGVDVKINKDLIELESSDIEKAGQAAANIEKGTKVRKRDRRIFQDGIFIIEKPGRSFL